MVRGRGGGRRTHSAVSVVVVARAWWVSGRAAELGCGASHGCGSVAGVCRQVEALDRASKGMKKKTVQNIFQTP